MDIFKYCQSFSVYFAYNVVFKGSLLSSDLFYLSINDLDFALVEETRPPMYKGLKYWGKKPHNIWSKYIETYCAPGDIVLDLFAGSGVSALEAVQLGRRAIAIDLNPITNFVVEFMVSNIDSEMFSTAAKKIISDATSYIKGLDQFFTECKSCNNASLVINYKWEADSIYEVAYYCEKCESAELKEPNHDDRNKAKLGNEIEITNWFPDKSLQIRPHLQIPLEGTLKINIIIFGHVEI